ncbi:MAG: ABC transporter ATP-binding protein [Cellulomonas sp.]|jgi:ABC-type glutathione transport system ATPase component|uniref:ATP-binding cassette domain-containing protein n=1 Tax=Cellulomonas sp. TaxID=40001 RepID=UPI001A0C286D|nr:ATP-binding cassette domain-containing protein [Cellulomonas sp.]MBF0688330.1 ABC transporter ATP-binding protein [Cellulomonas sp.]
MSDEPLLSVRNLRARYGSRGPTIVDDVSIDVGTREVVALVGESGSGKTTVARVVVGLLPAAEGVISFDGTQLVGSARSSEVRQLMQMVFQDPRSSLNPRMTVVDIVAEGWRVHPSARPAGDRRAAVAELLTQVGLHPSVMDRRPSKLSGGQCQRVSIARALALKPKLLVCDEAVSALDVSVQAQILRLLVDLREQLDLSLLFITHDLGVVRQISDRVAVMQHGRIVEFGDTESVFTDPQDPYTVELLQAALDVADDSIGTRGLL